MAYKVYLSKENFDTLDTEGTVDIVQGSTKKTITKSTNREYYVPLEVATTTEDGLMSSEDKTKLDGIITIGDVNVIEGIKLSDSASVLSLTDKIATIANATTTEDGLMSSEDKTKLDTYRDVTSTAYEKYTTESGSTLADFIKAFGYAIVGEFDEPGLFVATYEGDDTLIGLHNRYSGLAIIMGNDELYIYTNSTYSYATYATSASVTFEDTATNIKMNGTQALGSSGKVANSDHGHPSDTTKVDKVISSYTEETSPSGTELAFVDDGGTAKKITLANLKLYTTPAPVLLKTFTNYSSSVGSKTSWAGGYTTISDYDYLLVVITHIASAGEPYANDGYNYSSSSTLVPVSSFYLTTGQGTEYYKKYGGVSVYIDLTEQPAGLNATTLTLGKCILVRSSETALAYQLCGTAVSYMGVEMKIYGIKY